MPEEVRETIALPTLTSVRVTFDPYTYQSVQTLLRHVQADFGPNSSSLSRGTGGAARWNWTAGDDGGQNSFSMIFYFVNPHDAIMFSLKYSR
jgi:hypothetical protein